MLDKELHYLKKYIKKPLYGKTQWPNKKLKSKNNKNNMKKEILFMERRDTKV